MLRADDPSVRGVTGRISVGPTTPSPSQSASTPARASGRSGSSSCAMQSWSGCSPTSASSGRGVRGCEETRRSRARWSRTPSAQHRFGHAHRRPRGILSRSCLVKFASKEEMAASDDPVTRQFLDGRPEGPIGTDEMADDTTPPGRLHAPAGVAHAPSGGSRSGEAPPTEMRPVTPGAEVLQLDVPPGARKGARFFSRPGARPLRPLLRHGAGDRVGGRGPAQRERQGLLPPDRCPADRPDDVAGFREMEGRRRHRAQGPTPSPGSGSS